MIECKVGNFIPVWNVYGIHDGICREAACMALYI